MQARRRGVALAELGDLGAALAVLARLHQQGAVMRVSGDETVLVFDDDQVAQTTHAVAAVLDQAIRRGGDRVAQRAGNVDALAAGVEGLHDRAVGGPCPAPAWPTNQAEAAMRPALRADPAAAVAAWCWRWARVARRRPTRRTSSRPGRPRSGWGR
ncbi:hypothetical protein G6F63_014841 [Rhizopus arrhizus]|nr:hypothetical protein G6F63_014841 [Rhizopus arrhizus]